MGENFDEKIVFYEKIKRIDRQMTRADIQFNITALQSHFIFS